MNKRLPAPPFIPSLTGVKLLCYVASAAMLFTGLTPPVAAQSSPPASLSTVQSDDGAESFDVAQLDALLAPIALYPDVLLTHTLMAATNPIDIVNASRWLEQGSNKSLQGAALEAALKNQPWEPAVKSLVPFPQVLAMLNQNLEWTQQLGFAMQAQEADVFASIQRLRQQASRAGKLQSTPQQVVRQDAVPGSPQPAIVIEPAQPDVVYVPVYNPNDAYGAWPYPETPPVYYPPPPGYGIATAVATGLAFAAGVAVIASLWGWARPRWGWGPGWNYININAGRWNYISPHRPWRGPNNGYWRPNNPQFRPGGGWHRPSGPVGRPHRPVGLPSHAIGRPGVSVPGNVVRPPPGMGPGNRPGIGGPGIGGPGGGRPGQGQVGRPEGVPARPGQMPAVRPGGSQVDGSPGGGMQPGMATRPSVAPSRQPYRQPPAFSGMQDGRNAQSYGNRGGQSRQWNAPSRPSGGGFRGNRGR